MGPTPPRATELSNAVVTLRPAALSDADELFQAIGDERVWASGYAGGPSARPRDVPATQAMLETAVAASLRGERQAYVVRLTGDSELGRAGTLVGTTSLGDWDLANERVHLGWTAYGPAWWGTTVNPACKLALLGHAFDDCGFNRVKLQTDLINERSQAGIAKLGATREGVLRQHIRRPDGSWRDTVVFSVLRDEWPQVRAGLLARLS
jgi:RimJ/RimL family protein N-acetyltransferase